ncbi:uncharacterized protein LOC127845727 [Dreissena polymorpha]|uniref:uncharacterized protein LOC127845727 n=1 Tax=Dreissena polymorpha TaxID=45954 RepID=UPI002263B4C8|nr:uncharacterized protein LOC127845727 [Dreissena polymorpha]
MDALRFSAVCTICSYLLYFEVVDGISFKQMVDKCGSRITASGEHQLSLYFSGSRECEVTIETTSTFPWIMFYFQSFTVGCNAGSVSIRNEYGLPPNGLARYLCNYVSTSEVYTNNGDIKIKFTPKTGWSYGGFTLILTLFSDSDSCPIWGHVCDNGRCIDAGLKCNGYNTCGDNSECWIDHKFDYRYSGSSTVILGVGVAVVVVILIMVTVTIICCRRRHAQQRIPASASTMQVVYAIRADPGRFNQGITHSMYDIWMQQTAANAPQTPSVFGQQPPPYDPQWVPKDIKQADQEANGNFGSVQIHAQNVTETGHPSTREDVHVYDNIAAERSDDRNYSTIDEAIVDANQR